MGNVKTILAALLGAVIMLFALQNMSEVEVTFVVWSFQTRRIVVVFVSFIIGLAVGLLIGAHRKKQPPA